MLLSYSCIVSSNDYSCDDIYTFSSTEIKNLAAQKVSKRWYFDNCVACGNIENHLYDNYKHFYYAKCVSCENAKTMGENNIRAMLCKLRGWYEKKCGGNIFYNNNRNNNDGYKLRCSYLDEMTSCYINGLTKEDRYWYRSNCIFCSYYDDMSTTELQNMDDRIFKWYEEAGCTDHKFCTDDNQCNSNPDNLDCNHFDTLSSNQIDKLSNMNITWYRNNCINCAKYNLLSTDEEKIKLNNRIFRWHEEKCSNNNVQRELNIVGKRSCPGCLEEINDFNTNCIGTSDCRNNSNCYEKYNSALDLAKCCNMSMRCRFAASNVEKCYDNCFDSCVPLVFNFLGET